MEIAIQEMLDSRSEHMNKIDPIVGAVLVNSAGQELGRPRRTAPLGSSGSSTSRPSFRSF